MSENPLEAQARKTAVSYQGKFAWPTVLLGVVVFSGYFATPFLVVHGELPLWVGCALLAVLTYLSYTILHEAVHGSISGSHPRLRWVNELMGYMAGFVLMTPMTAHRHEHLTHHRNTNHADDDPDAIFGKLSLSPIRIIGTIYTLLAQNLKHYLATRWDKASRAQNAHLVLEYAVAIGARIAFCLPGYWLEGIVMMVVGGVVGIGILIYLFAYLVHRPHNVMGRYVDTSTIIAPRWCNGVVTTLWMWQNYHSIHHLYPRVPFYQYRRLFDEIRPVMEANGAPIYALTFFGLKNHNTPAPAVN